MEETILTRKILKPNLFCLHMQGKGNPWFFYNH